MNSLLARLIAPAIIVMTGIFFIPSLAVPASKESSLERAYGWMVDSITVSGNTKTKDFVVVREMETRPGSILDPRILERDRRYLKGLGLFAELVVHADSLRPGGCALRITVKERSEYFLKTLLPVVNYDFRKGFSFGIRWNNRNFRGRRESVFASYMRNADNDDSASMGWFAPWLGWRHIETGSSVWFFNRSKVPESFTVLEQLGGRVHVGIPLTASRISFSQVIASLSFEHRETGSLSTSKRVQKYLSPLAGIRLDSRDSHLRTRRGNFLFLAIQAWTAMAGKEQTYYKLWNNLRIFRPISERLELALQSDLSLQFGNFPEYSRASLGGSSTLRGYAGGEFTGYHVWHQTVEWRYLLLPTRVFRLPFLGFVDYTFSMVGFIDSGITWRSERTFAAENFHGGAGFGLRLYSPFQDVVRMDLGFNAHGDVYPYLRTGIRF